MPRAPSRGASVQKIVPPTPERERSGRPTGSILVLIPCAREFGEELLHRIVAHGVVSRRTLRPERGCAGRFEGVMRGMETKAPSCSPSTPPGDCRTYQRIPAVHGGVVSEPSYAK